jgi:hypothetical protein
MFNSRNALCDRCTEKRKIPENNFSNEKTVVREREREGERGMIN